MFAFSTHKANAWYESVSDDVEEGKGSVAKKKKKTTPKSRNATNDFVSLQRSEAVEYVCQPCLLIN